MSLRGLSTNSTLVLFDGLRAAYYPLADDGTRNFVDLNTIPDDIVDRVDVLRDGASSTYGADAIAGVVNIITKKQIKGVTGRAEGGISERGDAAQYRLSLTAGVGDLGEQRLQRLCQRLLLPAGRAVQPRPRISVQHQRLARHVQDGIQRRQQHHQRRTGRRHAQRLRLRHALRRSSARCHDAERRFPVSAPQYQYLSGCPSGTPYTLTGADRANPANAVAPNTVCQEDLVNLYGVIKPFIQRLARLAA